MASALRVVVAVDSASRVEPVLETAVALASGMRAELRALFVENVQLLRAAALPFVRELGVTSAQRRGVTSAGIERALQREATELRRRLGALAGALDVQWMLEVVRGEMVAAALAARGAGDMLILARSTALVGLPGSDAVTTMAPFAHLLRRPIAVQFEPGKTAETMLVAGESLARVAGAGLVVLIPAASAGAFRALRAQASEVLAARGLAARAFLCVPEHDPGQLAQALREFRAAVFLRPGSRNEREAAEVGELMRRVPCPVVVVP